MVFNANTTLIFSANTTLIFSANTTLIFSANTTLIFNANGVTYRSPGHRPGYAHQRNQNPERAA